MTFTGFLLDTSAVIAVFENTATGKQIVDLVGSDLKISEITCYEIVRKNPQREQLISDFDTVPFDGTARKHAVSLYGELKSRGRMANEFDILIAGLSLIHI